MPSEQSWSDFTLDVIALLYANIRDIEERRGYCDPEERDYLDGRLASYGEVLEILKHAAERYGLARELGLKG